MITDIYIPVIDTLSASYDHENISNEDYDRMVGDNFARNDGRVGRFVFDMMNNPQSFRIEEMHRKTEPNTAGEQIDYDEGYQYYYSEGKLTDSKNRDIDVSFFDEHLKKNDMAIVIFNINPGTVDMDAESELKYWLDESLRVHRDRRLNDRAKLLNLPIRTLKVKIDEKRYVALNKCKIVQDYSDKSFPFYFAALIENITE